MPKISIVVPVYKVEKYIHKCIDSILNQTFKNFELILVDDGSPDKCGFICNEYSVKDSRIKVIHKENGGLSSARNAGLDIARGEYIGFVDSDDFIERDMFETMLYSIENTNAKIAITGINTVDKNKIEKTFFTETSMILRSNETLEYILNGKISVSVWNKLYHKSLFNKLRFPEGKLHEDTFILTDIYKEDFIVVFINKEKYNYIIRSGSIMDGVYKKPNKDSIEAYDKIFEYYKSNHVNKLDETFWSCTSFNWNLLRSIYYNKRWNENDEYIKSMYNYLKKNSYIIYRNKYLNAEIKYEMIIFMILIRMNRLVYYLFLLKNKYLCELNRIKAIIRGDING